MSVQNLFHNLPAPQADEQFSTLLRTSGLHLERIVSTGQATPPGQWYDQEMDEWVLLLAGAATLRFDPDQLVHLEPGDFLHIAAHRRHRVERTDPHQPTVWLALHFEPA